MAKSPNNEAKLYLSTPNGTWKAVVCVNIEDFEACEKSSTKIVVQSVGTLQDRVVFATPDEIKISPGKTFYAFATLEEGQKQARQVFQFQTLN